MYAPTLVWSTFEACCLLFFFWRVVWSMSVAADWTPSCFEGVRFLSASLGCGEKSKYLFEGNEVAWH